jgi:hypothetical protein
MVWQVKYAYEHWNEDVLLLLHLGLPESQVKTFEDPRIIGKVYLRSQDRTYAEIFLLWESKKSYDEWYADYLDFLGISAEVQQYMESFGVNRSFYEPEGEDYNWSFHASSRPDKVQFPQNVIVHQDIFLPPGE